MPRAHFAACYFSALLCLPLGSSLPISDDHEMLSARGKRYVTDRIVEMRGMPMPVCLSGELKKKTKKKPDAHNLDPRSWQDRQGVDPARERSRLSAPSRRQL